MQVRLLSRVLPGKERKQIMYTSEELALAVKKLVYKPGWKFSFQTNPDMLVIVMYVQDARSTTGEMCNFTVKRLIPDYVDSDIMFTKWWEGVLADVEMHELREFARFDGGLIDTPHGV